MLLGMSCRHEGMLCKNSWHWRRHSSSYCGYTRKWALLSGMDVVSDLGLPVSIIRRCCICAPILERSASEAELFETTNQLNKMLWKMINSRHWEHHTHWRQQCKIFFKDIHFFVLAYFCNVAYCWKGNIFQM